MFSPEQIRQEFPIFKHHPTLVYLDSAATAQKPASVIQKEIEYYEQYATNIARGIYPLAEQATTQFESTRSEIADFIGAQRPEEVIFTANTTASLNLLALLLAPRIEAGDELIVAETEHHSNYLPWKVLAQNRGATLIPLPVTTAGMIDSHTLAHHINHRTKLVIFSAVSNVLGVINPVETLIRSVRQKNSSTLAVVDAAQIIGHLPVNVTRWDADFIAFSGHKLFGPTGIGVLWGKYALLESLPPAAFGGGMVLDACATQPIYKAPPARFEAGTPNIAGVIGLGAALKFIERIGLDQIREHEVALVKYTLETLKQEFRHTLQILGTTDPNQKSGIISFTLTGIHPHDVAYLLGEKGICVRAGLQCAAPLHAALALPASTRISLSVYNTQADIDQLIAGLKAVQTIL